MNTRISENIDIKINQEMILWLQLTHNHHQFEITDDLININRKEAFVVTLTLSD